MPTVSQALQQFAQAHRHHGDLAGNASEPTPAGYAVWIRCACGARMERWVRVEAAEDDLLRSRLLAGEN